MLGAANDAADCSTKRESILIGAVPVELVAKRLPGQLEIIGDRQRAVISPNEHVRQYVTELVQH